MDKIPRAEVLRYLGYRGQVLDEGLLSRLDEVIASCESELVSRGVFRIFAREISRESVTPSSAVVLCGTTLVLEGESIVRHLQGAEQVAVMACTLGAKSEQRIRQLSLLDPLAALIYDAAASALIEEGAHELSVTIAAEARSRKMVVNRRYSPGYGDFPLACQSHILRSIDATRCLGLTCNESNVMIPSKSITAVMGLFKAEREEGEL